ncbi:MAG TPA: M15 family metallopeptidase [Cytophagales bacterium]|nr:M15 family metallopeptidase [Cytophagales bacterium]
MGRIKIWLIFAASSILFANCSRQERQNEKVLENQGDSTIIKEGEGKIDSFSREVKDSLSDAPTISPLEQNIIDAGLVDIQSVDSSILVDLKYSTLDNFVKIDLYGTLYKCYLQKDVALKVAKAQQLLKERYPQLSLLIYDGVRPVSIQQILWDTLKVPEKIKHFYVANPDSASIHNFGAAVDLTLADSSGRAVDMGTEFDFFGPLAYPIKEDAFFKEGKLSVDQINNRLILRNVMIDAGFTSTTTEWWHFNSCSKAKAKRIYNLVK